MKINDGLNRSFQMKFTSPTLLGSLTVTSIFRSVERLTAIGAVGTIFTGSTGIDVVNGVDI